MIITSKTSRAMDMQLYDNKGNCITKMFHVMSYDTDTGLICYFRKGKNCLIDFPIVISTMPGLTIERSDYFLPWPK